MSVSKVSKEEMLRRFAKAGAFVVAAGDGDPRRQDDLIREFGELGEEGHTWLVVSVALLFVEHLKTEHPDDWAAKVMQTVKLSKTMGGGLGGD